METILKSENEPSTVGEALEYCARTLEQSDVFFGHGTDNPWDESVQLVLSIASLAHDSGQEVLPHPLHTKQLARIQELLQLRIGEHIPLPYLLGRAWFAGLEYLSDRRAIIPRSPIAELILNGFAPWYSGPLPSRVLDLCCGGGCIGLATAHYFPSAKVDLVDMDEQALALAQENARYLGVEEQTSIMASDLFQSIPGRRYDLILSNPPYVDAQDLATMPAEFHHEPPLALGSGPDGLALTRIILAQAVNHLNPQGLLIVEVGNSAAALEDAYPTVPFTWLEFENGGHGVFALSAKELQEFSASFAR
ncbi:MAG: 50S ribosomal protein L3 N(5)-glutamine methyltransferase [Halioglobus sp.]